MQKFSTCESFCAYCSKTHEAFDGRCWFFLGGHGGGVFDWQQIKQDYLIPWTDIKHPDQNGKKIVYASNRFMIKKGNIKINLNWLKLNLSEKKILVYVFYQFCLIMFILSLKGLWPGEKLSHFPWKQNLT